MIESAVDFIRSFQQDLTKWKQGVHPWFRGESGIGPVLRPKIADYTASQENHLVQSFRRKAGGLANTPPRSETDLWLFLAQHYGVPTRLLDWTEGGLLALYFATNQRRPSPRVYMLNPHRLNELAMGCASDYLNYPLSWGDDKPGYENIALAWQGRDSLRGFPLPIAIPATYQDHRMIAQRSCFTVHGSSLEPIPDILRKKGFDPEECLIEYRVDDGRIESLMKELHVLGVTSASIFPDLDHLAKDMTEELKHS